MKIFITLFALIVVVRGDPVVKSWTLNELSEALETNKADAEMRPYLIDALNQIMLAMFTGEKAESIQMLIPSPSGNSAWTMDELEHAVRDRNLSYKSYIFQAYHGVMVNQASDEVDKNAVKVYAPALDVSTWTLSDLNTALKSTSTNPDLRPYLNAALKKLTNGPEKKKRISMVTPIGLLTPKIDQSIY